LNARVFKRNSPFLAPDRSRAARQRPEKRLIVDVLSLIKLFAAEKWSALNGQPDTFMFNNYANMRGQQFAQARLSGLCRLADQMDIAFFGKTQKSPRRQSTGVLGAPFGDKFCEIQVHHSSPFDAMLESTSAAEDDPPAFVVRPPSAVDRTRPLRREAAPLFVVLLG
jgi:hypothetical protein